MKRYLIFLAVLALMVPMFAGVYTIGIGTSGSYTAPFNGLWDYSWSKVIYTLDEINTAGLTEANSITGIGFNVTNTPSNYAMNDQRIYVRHSSDTEYGVADIEHPDSAGFEHVYVGDVTYNGGGWYIYTFSTPFQWNGVQGLEFLFENHDGNYVSGYPNFAYTSTTPEYLMVHKAQDNSFPQGIDGARSYNRPNIQIFTPMVDPPGPAQAANPGDGASFVNVDTNLEWSNVMGADGYKLYLGTNPNPAFVADLGDVTTYNPNGLLHDTIYYWQVVPYNSYGDASNCPVWSFSTIAAGIVSIGDGTTTGIYLPINTLYGYSYSQTIYLQSEINMQDQRIEKIAYYWNGMGDGTNNNSWTIYMGHTDQESFATTTSWVPGSNLTQVYSGIVPITMDEGWMGLTLTNPFVYNNTQNLVIAVVEDSPGYTYAGWFLNTVAAGRSLRCQSDSDVPDPAAPPTATMQGHFPNILLEFGDLPDDPIFYYSPDILSFGSVLNNTPSEPQYVMIANTGGGTINTSAVNISLIGDNADEFDFDASNLPASLNPGENGNIQVSVTPQTEGEISATLRLVYDGVNYDVALSANGLPAGLLIIGEGGTTSRYPLGSYFGYERSAALYTATEIGGGNKRISNLAWFATQATTPVIPTKIYLKSYPGVTLATDNWPNTIEGATLVFDEDVEGVVANDWNIFNLSTTFDLDSGDNLLVLVERNYGAGGAGTGGTAPAIRATTMNNAHFIIQRDNVVPDETNNGTLQSSRPDLMFMATSYEITDPPNPAIAISPADGAEHVSLFAQLNWASGGGGPTGYELYFGTTNPPAYIDDLGDETTYNPGELVYSTTYYWQVIPYNNSGSTDSEDCPVWSFSVMDDPTEDLPWSEDFTGVAAGALPLNWTRTHANWGAVATANAGGESPELRMYWSPSVDGIVRAITPPLYGDNEGGYKLSFKHKVDHFSSGDPYTLKVEASTDLTNWTTLWSMVPTAIVTEIVEIQDYLLDYVGTPFYLAWTFDGNTYDINNWYVDDINIIPNIVGPAAAPILASPVNGAIHLPIDGFEMSWTPNLNEGGLPDYYAVFMAQDEDEIYGAEYFETDEPFFNPVTDGGLSFNYDERWYWAVEAINTYGSGVSEIFRFDIIGAPAEIAISPGFYDEYLDVGGTSIQPMYITNDGGMPLDYSIRFEDYTDDIRAAYSPVIHDIARNPNASRFAEQAPFAGGSVGGSRAYLDLQFIYEDADGGGEYGVASDGDFIYTSKWNGSGSQRFFKYATDGEYLGFFDIAGFSGVRDFTYDGTYFYGATASNTVYVMDFENESLVRTITVPSAARGIAYDADRDGLWITNNFAGPLRLVDMNGVQMASITTTATSFTGLTYDALSGNGTIWANTQSGPSNNDLVEIDPETGDTVSIIEVTSALLPSLNDDEDLGGGIEIAVGVVPGYASIIANVQNVMMYGLELCPVANWARAVPKSGVVAPGTTATIDIHFDSEGLPAGLYEGMLTVNHSAEGDPAEIPVSLTLTGEWLPIFNIDEVAWDFGTAELMNPITKEFTIRNSGGPYLTLTENSFFITGDAEGNFSLEALNLPVELDYNETYKFKVIYAPQSIGDKTASLNIEDGLGRNLHEIELSGACVAEPIGEILNLEANVENIFNVRLNWGITSGVAGEPGWLHYDNGDNSDGIGTGGTTNFDVAIKFTSADLHGHAGMQLEKIKFFPKSGNTEYTLKIWTGTDYSLAPSTLMYTQELEDVTPDQWNEVVLDTPFPITAAEAIWFGYNCDVTSGAQNHPAGCDNGPAVVGKGDLINLGGWMSLSAGTGLDYNWNLQGYVNDVRGIQSAGHWLNTPVASRSLELSNINLSTSGNPAPQTRVLRGFNVFRNGIQINDALIPSPTYLDGGLDTGTYTYTVQGVYYSGNTPMSDPAEVEIEIPPATLLPYSQDFEAHADNTLPDGWTRSSNGLGWEIGTDLSSQYWTIPAHTVYAAANDDTMGSGNDGSVDYLNMPALDFNVADGGSIVLSFDSYFTAAYGQLAYVKLSTDNLNWDLVYTVPSASAWTTRSVDLTAYSGNDNVFIRFHSSDDGDWASGWAIDNVLVDVVFTDNLPPEITHLPLINTPITDAPYEVIAYVVDDETWNNDVTLVQLAYAIDDGNFATVNMVHEGNDIYVAYIPAQPLESEVAYYITAKDSEDNEAESDLFFFEVDNPTWLSYDLGGTAYVTFGQEYGPAVLFDNPFYGTGTPMQLLAVDGDLYYAEEVTLVIYEVTDEGFAPIYIEDVEFDGVNFGFFDLSEEDVIIEGEQFLVAYQGVPADNYFLIDRDAYYYGRSYVILGGQLYMVSENDGAWAIGALVTDVVPEELDIPELSIALNADGYPTLSWTAVDGAAAYSIEISDDPYATQWSWWDTVEQTNYTYDGEERAAFFRVTATSEGIRAISQSYPISLSGEIFRGTRAIKAPLHKVDRK